jgi:hypothetical protein
MTSLKPTIQSDQTFKLAYLILIGLVYGILLWNFNGISPYRLISIPPFTEQEFIVRWLCLPLVMAIGAFSNCFVLKLFKTNSWLKLLIYSLVGFNFSYLLSTLLYEILEGDFSRSIDFYSRWLRALPLIVGFANIVIFVITGLFWLGFKYLSKLVTRVRLP